MAMTELEQRIEAEKDEAISRATSCCPYDGDEYHVYRSGYDSGMDKGIEISLSQFRWRKVEEVLPPFLTAVLLKVHVYADNYQSESVTVGHRDSSGYYFDKNGSDIKQIEVTEWMPIPE